MNLIELLARGLDPLGVLARPFAERADRHEQLVAKVGQLIVDAWRNGREHGPGDEAVALKTAQCGGQHLLRNAADGAAQFVEAQRSVTELADDEHGPLVADTLQDFRDGAAVLGAVRVPWYQKSASLRLVGAVTHIAQVSKRYQKFA